MRLTNTAAIATDQQTVTTSGTPVQLTSRAIPDGASLVVKSMAANSGTITIGNSSADALNTGSDHFKLSPGQSVSLQVKDANAIWVDSTVSGDGVEIVTEF
ncbi:MAG: hypothetical protein AABY01_03225 [Nanoarchaeota archaeon]